MGAVVAIRKQGDIAFWTLLLEAEEVGLARIYGLRGKRFGKHVPCYNFMSEKHKEANIFTVKRLEEVRQ